MQEDLPSIALPYSFEEDTLKVELVAVASAVGQAVQPSSAMASQPAVDGGVLVGNQASSISANAKSRASVAARETTKAFAYAHFPRTVGTCRSVQVLHCHSGATTTSRCASDLFIYSYVICPWHDGINLHHLG
jgi:hypothetical protein